MKKFLLVPLLMLLLSLSYAQNSEEYEKFIKESGEFSNLYRGQSPLIYNFRHTGTYFAYSEIFERGNLMYNGKFYNNLLLNLNSHLDELQISVEGSIRKVVLNNEFVEYFSIGSKNFVNLKEEKRDSGTIIHAGYYQVLYNGSSALYKKIKKVYSERINETMNSQTKSKLERIFSTSESYYLLKGGSFFLIKKKADLLSYYKEKKRDIRKFVRENRLDTRNDKDHSFSEIIRFVESGTQKNDE